MKPDRKLEITRYRKMYGLQAAIEKYGDEACEVESRGVKIKVQCSAADRKVMAAMYRDQKSLAAIATKFGVAPSTVRRQLDLEGEPIRLAGPVQKITDDEVFKKFQISPDINGIAKEYGVWPSTIRKSIDRALKAQKDK